MSCSSCLVFILDNKLSWSPHNKQISCNFKANIINITSFNEWRPQIFHLFDSKLFYLLLTTVFLLGDHHICSLNSHVCAVRLIRNLSPSIPIHKVLHMAKWKSLSYLYKKRIFCFLPSLLWVNTHLGNTKIFLNMVQYLI